MFSLAKLLGADQRRDLHRLQWFARNVVEGLQAGTHRSRHTGHSVEFKEHRPYVRGDETRSIDWKLFGKTDRLYIRQYEDETNLRCTLLLDQSGSMRYSGFGATRGESKHDFAVKLAACLAYLLISQQDAVGLATFDTQLREFLPARSRPKHLNALLDTMGKIPCAGDTDLAGVIGQIAPKIRRRGLVILLSDCFSPVSPLLQALARVRHAHNEVIVFQIWHPDELSFPFTARTQFQSLESDSERKLDPQQVRRLYMENLARFREELTQGCAARRLTLWPCTTDQSHSHVLSTFIAQRGRGR